MSIVGEKENIRCTALAIDVSKENTASKVRQGILHFDGTVLPARQLHVTGHPHVSKMTTYCATHMIGRNSIVC